MKTLIEMAREVKMPYDFAIGEPINLEKLKAFADLVRSDERERIIEKNKPVIEGANAHIKALEEAVLAEREAYRPLQDNGSKYFGGSWDTPPAQPAPAQKRPQNCGTGYCSCVECVMQPAVPDAIGPNEDELPAYAAGWNDCRAETLKMRKP